MSNRKVWEKKSFWLILLGVLCLVILVLGVVVVFNVRQEVAEQNIVISEENLLEQAWKDIEKIEDPTISQIISIYQNYIDIASGPEIKVALLEARIFAVQDMDLYYENGQQVIGDTMAIDSILQSLNSAAQVINVASFYGDEELLNKYRIILEERELEQGIDTNMETEG